MHSHFCSLAAVQITSGNRQRAGAVGVLMWCPAALQGGIENGDPRQACPAWPRWCCTPFRSFFPSISTRHFTLVVAGVYQSTDALALAAAVPHQHSSLITHLVLPSVATKPALLTEPYVLFSGDQDAGEPWKLHRLSSWGDERRHCGRVGTDWID